METRRDIHKLCLFYKIINHFTPEYLHSLLPSYVKSRTNYPLRNANHISIPRCKTNRYQTCFFPSTIKLWNDLPITLKSIQKFEKFKTELTSITRPKPAKWLFSGPRFSQILLTRMQLGFCSLNNYLFSRNLSVSSACTCGAPYEDLVHFFLHCPIHSYQRSQFLTAFNNMNIEFANQLNENNLVRLFTTGSPKLSNTMNQNVLQNTMNFISSTKRFDQSNPLNPDDNL